MVRGGWRIEAGCWRWLQEGWEDEVGEGEMEEAGGRWRRRKEEVGQGWRKLEDIGGWRLKSGGGWRRLDKGGSRRMAEVGCWRRTEVEDRGRGEVKGHSLFLS